jgi:hypothetical protein
VKIAGTGSTDDGIEAWFINRETREILMIPGRDSLLIQINNSDLNIGTAISNNRHCWTSHITRTDAANRTDFCRP